MCLCVCSIGFKELFAMWKNGDLELRRVLNANLMAQLEALLVNSVDDRKAAEKRLQKDEKDRLGKVALSKVTFFPMLFANAVS